MQVLPLVQSGAVCLRMYTLKLKPNHLIAFKKLHVFLIKLCRIEKPLPLLKSVLREPCFLERSDLLVLFFIVNASPLFRVICRSVHGQLLLIQRMFTGFCSCRRTPSQIPAALDAKFWEHYMQCGNCY